MTKKVGITRKERDALLAQQAEAEAELKRLRDLQNAQNSTKVLKSALRARDEFMPFVKFMMPDVERPNDVELSRYKNARHHDAIAAVMEEVEKGEIKQLILTMPPRHGKSELTTRKFPAWFIGRNPHLSVVVATYNDIFAQDFGRDVRSVIQSMQYRRVFPNVKLRAGSAAVDRLQTEQGGQLVFVGRGGSLTGRGAHCLPAGTMLETRQGSIPIEIVSVGTEVLSYDPNTGSTVWKAVQAVARRPRARLFRISTAAGRVVEATSDHRFYADDQWVEAAQLTAGGRLLCAMRETGRAPSGGLREKRSAGAYSFLLLFYLRRARAQLSAFWRSFVQSLRTARTEGIGMWDAEQWANILFGGVPQTGARRRVRHASVGAPSGLRTLQRDVCTSKLRFSILQRSVRQSVPFGANGGGREPKMEEWSGSQSSEAACDSALPRVETACDEARWAAVRRLFIDDTFRSPSYRREPAEQSGGESGDAVQVVPHDSALFRSSGDIVVTVEDTCRDAAVYDIQVAETECFFANGILVHNCLIIDDLIKDAVEASSQAVRDQAWNWLVKVAMTRRMGKKLVVLIMTRWHSDDPVGRLTDPENSFYSAVEAEKWKIINLPAIAEDDDPLGRAPGEPLWPDGPDQFDLDFLAQQQRLDPLGFAALYQQRPSAADGTLFRREYLQFYEDDQLPSDLRIYAASDHAVSVAARRDYTVLGVVGVDRQHNIYVLDVFWERAMTDRVVEQMITMANTRKPLFWWAERGHISKSIGPFLRKRMNERGVFFNLIEVTPIGDKEQRAQSIAGRMAQGKVFFPRKALWVDRAVNEMLGFPNATHDDFVDMLSLVGLGLGAQFAPVSVKRDSTPKWGTLAYLKHDAEQMKRYREREAGGGF